MSARTFYLAASSANIDEAKARVAELRALGWRCLYDWPAFMAEGRERPAGVASEEITSAVTADVFVALAPVTTGVAVEIGARLASWTTVHLVGEWDHVPFSSHPLVKHHASWEFFVARVAGGVA